MTQPPPAPPNAPPPSDALWTNWSQLDADQQSDLVAFLDHLATIGEPAEVLARLHTDLETFARVFFSDLMSDGGDPVPPAQFHHELYQIIQDAILKQGVYAREKAGAVVAAPRGHAKSSLLLMGVIWAVCEEHKRFPVILSGTDDQAEKIGLNIRREFEDNRFLRLYYGDLTGFAYKRKWTLKDFTLIKSDPESGRERYTAHIMVRGSGASVRGARIGAVRPDLVIADDVDTDVAVESQVERDWLFDVWWSGQILPMLHPQKGSIIVVGTILHFDSLLARLLRRDTVYEVRRWTCYDEETGRPIWPERFPLWRLKQIQRDTPRAFALEYLNDPTQTGTQPFRPEGVRFFTAEDLVCDQNDIWWWRGERLDVFGGVDPAIAEHEDACQFALVMIGVTRDRHDLLILRVVLDRIDFPAQVQIIGQQGKHFPAHRRIGIEGRTYQKALVQQVQRELGDLVRVRELTHGSGNASKRQRIMALAPLVAQGRVWFRAATDVEAGTYDALGRVRVHHSQYDLYQQMLQWPASALEDGLDALASAVEAVGGVLALSPGTFTGSRERTGSGRTGSIAAGAFVGATPQDPVASHPRHTRR